MTAKQGNPKADLPTEEKQIDKLVYDLYRLTPTEIEVVKSSIGQDEKSCFFPIDYVNIFTVNYLYGRPKSQLRSKRTLPDSNRCRYVQKIERIC